MSVQKNTYQLTKTKKLIDLNGDMTNFEISFKVTSKDNKPYDILVVDQSTLDNENSTLQYKRVQGEISGNVSSDKNQFQNYYLILKADEPCECEIELVKKELALTPPPPPPPSPPELLKPSNIKTTSDINWGKVFIVVSCVVGICIVLYILTKKEEGSQEYKVSPQSIAPAPLPAPVPTQPVLPVQNPLLARLQNLNIPN